MSFLKQCEAAIEERAALSDQLLAIPKAAAEREGTEAGKPAPLNAEERQKFDKIDEDIRALDGDIARLKRLRDEEAKANERQALLVKRDTEPDESETRVDFNSAAKRWGLGEETPEDRAALGIRKHGRGTAIELAQPLIDHRLMSRDRASINREFRDERMTELRAQSVGTNTEGGFTVPEGFWNSLIESRLAFGGMRQARTFVFQTATGNDLPIPTTDDTSNVGAILTENTEDAEQGVTFGQIILQAFKYTSKFVLVSFELMQDSAFDIASHLGGALGVRLGRIENTHFTTGTGSAQPNGAVTASSLGKTAASSTAITYAEIIDLEHSVDPAYRLGAEFMFNDSTLAAIKKLTVGSSDARPLWAPGMAVGQPNTIDGQSYVINQDMASIATGNKVMLWGDFSQYFIRDVGSMRLKRLDERYAEFDQVAFVALMRTDADLIDAGTDPLKHYIMA